MTSVAGLKRPRDIHCVPVDLNNEKLNIVDSLFLGEIEQQVCSLVSERIKSLLVKGSKMQIHIYGTRILPEEPRQDSKILLVDTATSAHDWASEKVVPKIIDQATIGITTCVIAHRSSTILKADPILGIVAGELRGKGIHIELMATKGIYYQLYK